MVCKDLVFKFIATSNPVANLFTNELGSECFELLKTNSWSLLCPFVCRGIRIPVKLLNSSCNRFSFETVCATTSGCNNLFVIDD